jgi:hypothetical protein
MKKIIGIKCQNKFYITELVDNRYNPYISVEQFLFDGFRPKTTFHSEWVVVSEEPKLIQEYKKQPNINFRYQLIDKNMVSSHTPYTLKRVDALEDGDRPIWKEKFALYRSMYEICSDEQPDILIDIDFRYETVMEVAEIKEFEEFDYDVEETRWERRGSRKITEGDIQHQLLDEIVFPNILLPSRPCLLTSQQTFAIVRQYVKQHINYDVASITLDFNFCFTVKKKIPLSEPTKYTVDVNNSMFSSRKRKPKYEARYKSEREAECFEMAPEPYQKYTVINGFRGEDQNDLKHKIDTYCKSLILFINTPIRDCPRCEGSGIILGDAFNTKMEKSRKSDTKCPN